MDDQLIRELRGALRWCLDHGVKCIGCVRDEETQPPIFVKAGQHTDKCPIKRLKVLAYKDGE